MTRLSQLVILSFGFFLPSTCAQLPGLVNHDRLGYFVSYERKDFQFGISSTGDILIEIIGSTGKPMGFTRAVKIEPVIMDMSDPKPYPKKLVVESLTSAQPATDKPEKITFRGKVTGDAEFEMTLEFKGDEIMMGGKLVNSGTLKTPVFQIHTRFQQPYQSIADEKLEKATEKDRISFVRIDKKKDKIGVYEVADFTDEKKFDKGQTAIAVEISAYDGKELEFSIEGPGVMKLTNAYTAAYAPMKGFRVVWQHDVAADPEAKGRIHCVIK